MKKPRPIAYPIDAGRVLFHNTAWYAEGDEDSGARPVEQPLVFRRVEGDGEPQPIVTFHPGTNLTPAARPPQPGPKRAGS